MNSPPAAVDVCAALAEFASLTAHSPLLGTTDPGTPIDAVELLADHTPTAERDRTVLVVAPDPAHHQLQALQASRVVLLLDPADEDGLRLARDIGVSWILRPSGASWASVIAICHDLISGSGTTEPDPTGALFALADELARIVDGAVTIETIGGAVVAFSTAGHPVDNLRRETITGLHAPTEVVSYIRTAGVLRRLRRANGPIRIDDVGPDGAMSRAVIPLRLGPEVVGAAWVVDPERAVDGDRVNGICLRIATALARVSDARQGENRLLAARVAQLAAGGTLNTVADDLLPISGPWRFVIPMDDTAYGRRDQGLPRASVTTWLSFLRRNGWQNPTISISRGETVVLVGAEDSPGGWPWMRRLFTDGSNRGLQLAAGRPVADLAQLAQSATDAVHGRDWLAHSREAVFDYESDWARPAVAAVASHLRAEKWVPERVDALRDRELSDAFMAWFDAVGDARAAAALLGVHPNTIRNRIARCRRLIGPMFDQPEYRLALRILSTIETSQT